MVISGSGPNLSAELECSQNQAGFPDPDLFDHLSHSRGDFLNYLLFETPALILCRLKGYVIAEVFALCQHRPDRPRHLIGKRDGNDEPGLSFQHPCQPRTGHDPFTAQPIQPCHRTSYEQPSNVGLPGLRHSA